MLDPTSRYAKLPHLTYTTPEGRTIVHLAQRFVPQSASIPSQGGVTVQQSDRVRLDLIAFRTLRQPELFWRLADANDGMNPFLLTEPAGRVLRVPSPQI